MPVWAACEQGELGPMPAGYFSDRELAKRAAEREFAASDEAERTDYEDSYEEIKVKRQMGIPVEPIQMYDLTRFKWRYRFRGAPTDGDALLMVWRNVGAYGPGWHVTDWMIEKITVQDTLEAA